MSKTEELISRLAEGQVNEKDIFIIGTGVLNTIPVPEHKSKCLSRP